MLNLIFRLILIDVYSLGIIRNFLIIQIHTNYILFFVVFVIFDLYLYCIILPRSNHFHLKHLNIMKIFQVGIIIILLVCPVNSSNDIPLKFENISITDGLSQNTVNCFLKDSKGFIWIGTCGGLNRYDGVDFKIFRPDPYDPKSLNSNYIWKMIEVNTDTSRHLWLATHGGGLNCLDINAETFTYFTHDPDNSNSISNDYINAICTDDSGYIWLGTTGGINRFDPKTQKFSHIRNDPDDINSLGSDYVNNLQFDNHGQLWIGTLGSGVDFYDPESRRFMHFRSDQNDNRSLSNNFVWAIYQDNAGHLWIGTQNGLNKIDASQLTNINNTSKLPEISFKRYIHDSQDEYSISGNWVIDITEDSDGNLWIVTHGKGLNKFNPDTEKFIRYQNNSYDPHSINSDVLRSIYTDGKSDIFWVGSESAGLSKFLLNQKPFYYYNHNPDDPNSLAQKTVFQFCEDSFGYVWIGLETEGVDRYDPQSKDIQTLSAYPK